MPIISINVLFMPMPPIRLWAMLSVRPYPEKDRKRLETPKKTRKRPKKTLFSTEFYII